MPHDTIKSSSSRNLSLQISGQENHPQNQIPKTAKKTPTSPTDVQFENPTNNTPKSPKHLTKDQETKATQHEQSTSVHSKLSFDPVATGQTGQPLISIQLHPTTHEASIEVPPQQNSTLKTVSQPSLPSTEETTTAITPEEGSSPSTSHVKLSRSELILSKHLPTNDIRKDFIKEQIQHNMPPNIFQEEVFEKIHKGLQEQEARSIDDIQQFFVDKIDNALRELTKENITSAIHAAYYMHHISKAFVYQSLEQMYSNNTPLDPYKKIATLRSIQNHTQHWESILELFDQWFLLADQASADYELKKLLTYPIEELIETIKNPKALSINTTLMPKSLYLNYGYSSRWYLLLEKAQKNFETQLEDFNPNNNYDDIKLYANSVLKVIDATEKITDTLDLSWASKESSLTKSQLRLLKKSIEKILKSLEDLQKSNEPQEENKKSLKKARQYYFRTQKSLEKAIQSYFRTKESLEKKLQKHWEARRKNYETSLHKELSYRCKTAEEFLSKSPHKNIEAQDYQKVETIKYLLCELISASSTIPDSSLKPSAPTKKSKFDFINRFFNFLAKILSLSKNTRIEKNTLQSVMIRLIDELSKTREKAFLASNPFKNDKSSMDEVLEQKIKLLAEQNTTTPDTSQTTHNTSTPSSTTSFSGQATDILPSFSTIDLSPTFFDTDSIDQANQDTRSFFQLLDPSFLPLKESYNDGHYGGFGNIQKVNLEKVNPTAVDKQNFTVLEKMFLHQRHLLYQYDLFPKESEFKNKENTRCTGNKYVNTLFSKQPLEVKKKILARLIYTGNQDLLNFLLVASPQTSLTLFKPFEEGNPKTLAMELISQGLWSCADQLIVNSFRLEDSTISTGSKKWKEWDALYNFSSEHLNNILRDPTGHRESDIECLKRFHTQMKTLLPYFAIPNREQAKKDYDTKRNELILALTQSDLQTIRSLAQKGFHLHPKDIRENIWYISETTLKYLDAFDPLIFGLYYRDYNKNLTFDAVPKHILLQMNNFHDKGIYHGNSFKKLETIRNFSLATPCDYYPIPAPEKVITPFSSRDVISLGSQKPIRSSHDWLERAEATNDYYTSFGTQPLFWEPKTLFWQEMKKASNPLKINELIESSQKFCGNLFDEEILIEYITQLNSIKSIKELEHFCISSTENILKEIERNSKSIITFLHYTPILRSINDILLKNDISNGKINPNHVENYMKRCKIFQNLFNLSQAVASIQNIDAIIVYRKQFIVEIKNILSVMDKKPIASKEVSAQDRWGTYSPEEYQWKIIHNALQNFSKNFQEGIVPGPTKEEICFEANQLLSLCSHIDENLSNSILDIIAILPKDLTLREDFQRKYIEPLIKKAQKEKEVQREIYHDLMTNELSTKMPGAEKIINQLISDHTEKPQSLDPLHDPFHDIQYSYNAIYTMTLLITMPALASTNEPNPSDGFISLQKVKEFASKFSKIQESYIKPREKQLRALLPTKNKKRNIDNILRNTAPYLKPNPNNKKALLSKLLSDDSWEKTSENVTAYTYNNSTLLPTPQRQVETLPKQIYDNDDLTAHPGYSYNTLSFFKKIQEIAEVKTNLFSWTSDTIHSYRNDLLNAINESGHTEDYYYHSSFDWDYVDPHDQYTPLEKIFKVDCFFLEENIEVIFSSMASTTQKTNVIMNIIRNGNQDLLDILYAGGVLAPLLSENIGGTKKNIFMEILSRGLWSTATQCLQSIIHNNTGATRSNESKQEFIKLYYFSKQLLIKTITDSNKDKDTDKDSDTNKDNHRLSITFLNNFYNHLKFLVDLGILDTTIPGKNQAPSNFQTKYEATQNNLRVVIEDKKIKEIQEYAKRGVYLDCSIPKTREALIKIEKTSLEYIHKMYPFSLGFHYSVQKDSETKVISNILKDAIQYKKKQQNTDAPSKVGQQNTATPNQGEQQNTTALTKSERQSTAVPNKTKQINSASNYKDIFNATLHLMSLDIIGGYHLSILESLRDE